MPVLLAKRVISVCQLCFASTIWGGNPPVEAMFVVEWVELEIRTPIMVRTDNCKFKGLHKVAYLALNTIASTSVRPV